MRACFMEIIENVGPKWLSGDPDLFHMNLSGHVVL